MLLVCVKAVETVAAAQPTHGWSLINYINYGDPIIADLAFCLLMRGTYPHNRNVQSEPFAGMIMRSSRIR